MIAARALALLLALLSVSGCAVGYNRVLFVTKSNIGLDVDNSPPTVELTLSRREGAIGPTFEGGVKPPVLASFRSRFRGILGIFFSVSSTFAGGDAADTMSKLWGEPDDPAHEPADSARCLTKKPEPKVFGRSIEFPEPGDVKPFVFGTDTAFGLKIAWSGATAHVPDSVKLGYNRKEYALAPLFVAPAAGGECAPGQYRVAMPSFLATVDHGTEATGPGETGTIHLQYFATGQSATNLALRQDVRAAMLRRLDPAAAARLEELVATQDSRFGLARTIRSAFDTADDGRKQAIVSEAIRLAVVPPRTTVGQFSRELTKAANPQGRASTDDLKALAAFATRG